jgi:hypothetical protein
MNQNVAMLKQAINDMEKKAAPVAKPKATPHAHTRKKKKAS